MLTGIAFKMSQSAFVKLENKSQKQNNKRQMQHNQNKGLFFHQCVYLAPIYVAENFPYSSI